jgi:hypothetical protein
MLDVASSTNLRSLWRPPDRASAFYHMYFFFELTTELAIPNVTNTGHFAHSPAARLIRSTWAKRESTNAANRGTQHPHNASVDARVIGGKHFRSPGLSSIT